MMELVLSLILSFVIGASVFFLQGCGSGEEGDEISINVGDGEQGEGIFGDPVTETNVDSNNDEDDDKETKYFEYH